MNWPKEKKTLFISKWIRLTGLSYLLWYWQRLQVTFKIPIMNVFRLWSTSDTHTGILSTLKSILAWEIYRIFMLLSQTRTFWIDQFRMPYNSPQIYVWLQNKPIRPVSPRAQRSVAQIRLSMLIINPSHMTKIIHLLLHTTASRNNFGSHF